MVSSCDYLRRTGGNESNLPYSRWRRFNHPEWRDLPNHIVLGMLYEENHYVETVFVFANPPLLVSQNPTQDHLG